MTNLMSKKDVEKIILEIKEELKNITIFCKTCNRYLTTKDIVPCCPSPGFCGELRYMISTCACSAHSWYFPYYSVDSFVQRCFQQLKSINTIIFYEKEHIRINMVRKNAPWA